MTSFIKQCVGVDCAMEELVVTVAGLTESLFVQEIGFTKVANNKTGFLKLFSWIKSLTSKGIKPVFVIEATGVYHESFAHFVVDYGYDISVVLPSKIKHFRKSLDIKTDNDKTASFGIAHFGLSRKLDLWKKPDPTFKALRSLIRERNQLLEESTSANNQLHAVNHSDEQNPRVIARLQARITFCKKQISEIEKDLITAISDNQSLKSRLENLCTIKGVGLLTTIAIIAETDGFALIRNKRQLVSYAGFDVVEKQSGISVRGKARMSKRGNKNIRKALYFPSMSAVRHDPGMKNDFARIVSRSGIKMKALVAIQRKLLVLIYTLWKKNEPFDPDYNQNEDFENKSGWSSLTNPTELAIAALEDKNN